METRIQHDRTKKNFVQISNKLLQNNELSFAARGLLAYALSLPESFVISKKNLFNNCKEGKVAMGNIFKELISQGYCHKEEWREGGQFKYKFHFFECPEDNDFLSVQDVDKDTHRGQLTDIGKPTSITRPHNNTIIRNTLEKNTLVLKESDKEKSNQVENKLFQLNTKKENPQVPQTPPLPKYYDVLESDSVKDSVNQEFKPILREWLDYKWGQFKFKYKSEKSFLTLYNDLFKWSGGNVLIAKEIVSNSIRNGYMGIFEPKGQPNIKTDYLGIKKNDTDNKW